MVFEMKLEWKDYSRDSGVCERKERLKINING